jgi:hypothetical protein
MWHSYSENWLCELNTHWISIFLLSWHTNTYCETVIKNEQRREHVQQLRSQVDNRRWWHITVHEYITFDATKSGWVKINFKEATARIIQRKWSNCLVPQDNIFLTVLASVHLSKGVKSLYYMKTFIGQILLPSVIWQS